MYVDNNQKDAIRQSLSWLVDSRNLLFPLLPVYRQDELEAGFRLLHLYRTETRSSSFHSRIHNGFPLDRTTIGAPHILPDTGILLWS